MRIINYIEQNQFNSPQSINQLITNFICIPVSCTWSPIGSAPWILGWSASRIRTRLGRSISLLVIGGRRVPSGTSHLRGYTCLLTGSRVIRHGCGSGWSRGRRLSGIRSPASVTMGNVTSIISLTSLGTRVSH